MTDAFVFFLIGLAMCLAPALWPDHFSGEINRGGCSEIWLVVMGATQMVMGTWAVGLNAVPRVVQYLTEWEPVPLKFELVDIGLVLSESFYLGLDDTDEENVAMSLQQQLRMGYA